MKVKATNNRVTRGIVASIAIAAALATGGAGAEEVSRDIVIYGSSSAASMAAANGTAVQDVPYAKLRERLDADGQVMSLVESAR